MSFYLKQYSKCHSQLAVIVFLVSNRASWNSDQTVKIVSIVSNMDQYSVTASSVSYLKLLSETNFSDCCNMRSFVARQAAIISCWTDGPKRSSTQVAVRHPPPPHSPWYCACSGCKKTRCQTWGFKIVVHKLMGGSQLIHSWKNTSVYSVKLV